MYPKKVKEFYKEYAELKGIDEAEVQVIMDYFYKELSERLKNLHYPRIYVKGIGTFIFKHWKLEEYEQKQQPYKKGATENWQIDGADHQLALLANMREMVHRDKVQAALQKQVRKIYDREKQMGGTLGEQGEDTDGDSEQVSQQGDD